MGIVDDVTFSSLPYGAEPEVLPAGTTECLFWGMGSDGTVGANKEAVKIIASQEGMNAQVPGVGRRMGGSGRHAGGEQAGEGRRGWAGVASASPWPMGRPLASDWERHCATPALWAMLPSRAPPGCWAAGPGRASGSRACGGSGRHCIGRCPRVADLRSPLLPHHDCSITDYK